MLQQTQVATVVPYYERWIARFPDLASLAAAEEGEVLLLWEGLGYYNRARNFHRAARLLVEEHGGAVPRDAEVFRALPGVGEYTTAAVQSLAFDADLAVLDGNVKRVLARLITLEQPPSVSRVHKQLAQLAQQLLPAGQGKAALHNQAMMELGARVCTPRSPSCDECPLAAPCAARAAGQAEAYPRKAPKRAVPLQQLAVAVLEDERGRLLLYERPYGGMLAGLWDLPAAVLRDEAGQAIGPEAVTDELVAAALLEALLAQHGCAAAIGEALPPVDHVYSHLRVRLHPRRCTLAAMAPADRAAETSARWLARSELGSRALPRATHKVLASLDEQIGSSG
jgi:A/G-specific adenine glycosylase